jgi:hypothetical protein
LQAGEGTGSRKQDEEDAKKGMKKRRKTEADAAAAEPNKMAKADDKQAAAAADARSQNGESARKLATQTVEKTETDEAKRMRALIAGKCVDIKSDILAQLQKGDAETVQLLGKMYPAGKKQQCQFCRESFFPGAASKCNIAHNVTDWDFDDFNRYSSPHEGTCSGTCELCGEQMKCYGSYEDYEDFIVFKWSFEPERVGVCYAAEHVESSAEAANIVKRLRKERMEPREYEGWCECGSNYYMGGKHRSLEDIEAALLTADARRASRRHTPLRCGRAASPVPCSSVI